MASVTAGGSPPRSRVINDGYCTPAGLVSRTNQTATAAAAAVALANISNNVDESMKIQARRVLIEDGDRHRPAM